MSLAAPRLALLREIQWRQPPLPTDLQKKPRPGNEYDGTLRKAYYVFDVVRPSGGQWPERFWRKRRAPIATTNAGH